MDNDSAEVTSSGRSFHVRGPTTGKARLVGDGCQTDGWCQQNVEVGGQEVGDIVEWTKVLRCESVQDFEDQMTI